MTAQQLEKVVSDQKKEGKSVHIRIYNNLIEKYALSNDLAGISRTLQTLRLSGLTPSAFIYARLIGAYARNHDIDSAFQYYEEMTAAGFAPQSLVFSSLIFAALQSNNEAKAEQLYKEMLQSNCVLTPHPYATFLRFYRDNPEKQMRWYNEMQARKVPMNARAFVHLMKGAERSFSLVQKLFREEMPKHGVVANDHIFSNIISIAGKHDRIAEAEAFFAEMKQMGIEPSVISYTALMAANKRHNPKRSIELLDEILRIGLRPTFITWSVAIEAAGQLKDLELTEKLFKQAKDTCPAIRLSYIYSSFIFACGQVKTEQSLQKAREAFGAAYAAKQLEARAYSSLIYQYCEAKQWEKAVAIFDLTSHLATGLVPFGGIIRGAIALDRFDDAERYLQHMQQVKAPRAASLAALVEAAKAKRNNNEIPLDSAMSQESLSDLHSEWESATRNDFEEPKNPQFQRSNRASAEGGASQQFSRATAPVHRK